MTTWRMATLVMASALLSAAGCPKPEPGTMADAPASEAETREPSTPDVVEAADDARVDADDESAPSDATEPTPAPTPDDGAARVVNLTLTATIPKYSSCSPKADWDYADSWRDDPKCARLEKVWSEIPSADRAYRQAADCRATDLYCMAVPMNAKALAKKKYAEGPCWPPAMGQCNPDRVEPQVDCVQGCCVVAGGGSDDEGQAFEALLRTRLDNALRSCKVERLDGPLELRFDYGQAPVAWDDGRLSAFGDEARACLVKVLPRLVKSRRSETGYAYEVAASLQ